MSKFRTVNRIARLLKKRIRLGMGRTSYSECGEDLIVDNVFSRLGITNIPYLDLGANDPVRSSNTFYFYRKGNRGVLVEPDPFGCAELRRARKNDVCLNVGVGISPQNDADFYVVTPRTLSTFSKELAEEYRRSGGERVRIERTVRVPLVSVNEIMGSYYESFPYFVSIDVEGLDLEILKSVDFRKFRPIVFCVEAPHGNREMDSFMNSHGYFSYAHTWVNAIYAASEHMTKL